MLRLKQSVLVLACSAFVLVCSSNTVLAEILSTWDERANSFVTDIMRRTGIRNAGDLEDKKDDCLHTSRVNRIYIDTEKFTTCMLGSSKKASSGRSKPQADTEKKTLRGRLLDEKANVDPDPDWAGATRERILKGKQGKVLSVNQNGRRVAPYGPSSCAEIKAAPNRGVIDWDSVIIRNKCSYPIKVLVCYYDQGRAADCAGKKGWGLSDLLSPGETQDSVATSKRLPWFAKILVCDMREKSDLMCVLPD